MSKKRSWAGEVGEVNYGYDLTDDGEFVYFIEVPVRTPDGRTVVGRVPLERAGELAESISTQVLLAEVSREGD